MIALCVWPATPSAARSSPLFQPAGVTFPQTGKSVSGDFLHTFNKYGLALIGYPISDVMSEDGLTVQYFERARMEHHPELASKGQTVQFTRLGAHLAGKIFARIKVTASTSSRLYFTGTGHSLSGDFLRYWRANGGVEFFGYPISEPRWEGSLKVQWFERARMEHHPELARKGQTVLLTRLGSQLHAKSAAGKAAPPPPPPPPPADVELSWPEKELLVRINAARASAGLAPVQAAVDLTALARSRSADMAGRGYFAHATPEGTDFLAMLKQRGIGYRLAGEIIAKNNYKEEAQAPGVAVDTFLNSPSHRAIIMDARYNLVGVGYSKSGDGWHHFTAIFTQK